MDGGCLVYFLWGEAFILGEVCVWLRLSYVLRWPTHTQRRCPRTTHCEGNISSQGAFSWEATTKYLVYISKSHELVGGISKPALLTQFLHPPAHGNDSFSVNMPVFHVPAGVPCPSWCPMSQPVSHVSVGPCTLCFSVCLVEGGLPPGSHTSHTHLSLTVFQTFFFFNFHLDLKL